MFGTLKTTKLKWRPRLKVFQGCNRKCWYDPATKTGYSYRTSYKLAGIINGQMVLNSYPYSTTTTQHVHAMHSLLKELGIPFVAVHAPDGLDDLDEAMTYSTRQVAYGKLKQSHARIPDRWDGLINVHNTYIERLAGFGVARPGESRLAEVARQVENNRKALLEMDKKRSAWKRVKVVVANGCNDMPGVHIYCADGWAQDWRKQAMQHKAADHDLKTVFLHIEIHRTVAARVLGVASADVEVKVIPNNEPKKEVKDDSSNLPF